MHDQYSVSWKALEYEHFEKTPDWFWGLGVIVIVAAGISIFLGNILFAIVLVLAGFTLALHAAKPPKVEHFAISDRGVLVGNTLYPFTTLDSFWVENNEHSRALLFLKSKKFFMPLLTIPIEEINPEQVHAALSDMLPEEEHRETFAEHLFRWLRF